MPHRWAALIGSLGTLREEEREENGGERRGMGRKKDIGKKEGTKNSKERPCEGRKKGKVWREEEVNREEKA